MKKIVLVGLMILAFAAFSYGQEQNVNINAGNYYARPITFKTTSAIVGNFVVRTIHGEVEGLVMTEENFTKWRNNQAASFMYDSGKKAAGNIFLRVRPGTYYVVISNRFTPSSNKTVGVMVNGN